jgi:hypothetical protein
MKKIVLFYLPIFFYSCGLPWEKVGEPKKVNQDCVIVKYNQKNQMIDSLVYINQKIEGVRFTLDTVEQIKIYSIYKNGVLDGEQNGFNLNGKLSFKVKFEQGKKVGEGFYYDELGNLQCYEYRIKDSNTPVFQTFYKGNKNITKCAGRGLIKFNRLKDTIAVGEVYYGEAIMAKPPYMNSVLMLADFTPDSSGVNHEINLEKGELRHVNFKFKKPGHYKKIFFWALEDTVTQYIYKDFEVLDIWVK